MSNTIGNILPKLQELAKVLEAAIRVELLRQGHKATGKLEQSLQVGVKGFLDGFQITGESVFYGEYVDKGRLSGGKKVPIDALIEWIRIKKISFGGMSEKQMAFVIQKSIWKNGIPTNKDFYNKRYFVSQTLEKKETEMKEYIYQACEELIDFEVNNLIEKTNVKLK